MSYVRTKHQFFCMVCQKRILETPARGFYNTVGVWVCERCLPNLKKKNYEGTFFKDIKEMYDKLKEKEANNNGQM